MRGDGSAPAFGGRVVCTGLGLITPLGIGAAASWDELLAGASGVRPVEAFEPPPGLAATIAAEVRGFDAGVSMGRKAARQSDRFVHLALAAADEAWTASGLAAIAHRLDPSRLAVCIGSGIGGIGSVEEQTEVLRRRGPRRVHPFLIPRLIANMAAGHVALRLGCRGPCLAPATACAAGAHAIGEAYRWLSSGLADVAVAGGAEAAVTPLSLAGFAAMKALSRRNDDPAGASRPFDRDRDGFVVAEGAGIVILERAEHALGRGADILGEIAGYGASADAHHIAAPPEDGRGALAAMAAALKDAGLGPEDVDYVNAHATSTPLGDRAELAALESLFHRRTSPVVVSSTKGATGHALGAAGGIEAAFTLLALRNQIVPPTLNLANPDPAPGPAIHLLAAAPENKKLDVALSNSFGFGGTNASLIMRRWPQ